MGVCLHCKLLPHIQNIIHSILGDQAAMGGIQNDDYVNI